jgi:hypothetical protein
MAARRIPIKVQAADIFRAFVAVVALAAGAIATLIVLGARHLKSCQR